MANNLTGLIPILYEGLDIVSRELVGFTRAVSMDSKAESAAVGQVVRSPVSQPAELEDIVPGVTPPSTGDQNFDYVDVVITNAKASPIKWTGEEMLSVSQSRRGMMADQFAQSVRAIVNQIELDLFNGIFPYCSRAYGTPGTTPFGTAGDLSDVAEVLAILEDNGAPTSDLHLVLGSRAIANIRGKQSGLFEVNRAGTEELLRTGAIADIEGFMIHNSRAVKPVAAGDASGYTTASAVVEGDSVVDVTGGTGAFLVGDVITLAGDTNQYTIVNVNGDTLTIAKPGFLQDHTSGKAVTLLGTSTRNVALARSSSVLALRAPAMPVDENGKAIDMALDVTTITDPNSGLSFQIAMYAGYRQVRYEVAAAWGVKMVKEEHACLLLG